jgi:hypothetical protein
MIIYLPAPKSLNDKTFILTRSHLNAKHVEINQINLSKRWWQMILKLVTTYSDNFFGQNRNRYFIAMVINSHKTWKLLTIYQQNEV